MELNNDKNKEKGEEEEEEEGSRSSLKLKISELESKLRAQKQRFDLLQSELELSKLILSQEVEKNKRECVYLKESVARLEEDRNILREREVKDQKRIRNLLEKIEKNEREFSDKLIELKLGDWDFEFSQKKMHEEVHHAQENGNKNSRPKKKFKLSDSIWTSIARIPSSTGNNDVSDKGVRAYLTGDIKHQSSKRSYRRRHASSEQLPRMIKRAEEFWSNLNSSNPSFIKPMVPSSVSGGFSLHIPGKFCKVNLPDHELMMILEDEKGLEYKAKYISKQTVLSGGWIGFATAHNLGLGDILIFELREPARFKIYIIKAIPESSENFEGKMVCECTEGTSKWPNNNIICSQDVEDGCPDHTR